jgi:hypothetical protein
MEDSISKLLAGLQKPSRRYRSLSVRITDAEFLELQSYAATRYLNYSDVCREAITAYLRNPNPIN